MIAWGRALALAARLVEDRASVDRALGEVSSSARAFSNRDYPLSPLPLLLDAGAVTAAVPVLETYVGVLGRLVEAYREHAEVRAWFSLDRDEEALVLADRRLGDAPVVCRLDGYLEQGTERIRLLENNADAPAGTLFTPRVNRAVREVLRRSGSASLPVALEPDFAGEHVLLDALRRCGERAGARRTDVVTVLQRAGTVSREVAEMVLAFRDAGCDAAVADPRELDVRDGRARFGERPAGLVWNKVNTVDWRRLTAADPTLARRWLRALDDRDFVHVNPFGARFVAESKLSLALLGSSEFAALFSPAQREAVAALLPGSQRLVGGDAAAAAAHEHPSRYVVKDAYDIRGDGVRIGSAAGAREWADAIAPPAGTARLLQHHVAPTSYPVYRRGSPVGRIVCMATSLDTYVVGGTVAGFGAKASTGAKVNVFQGGQKLSVQVVAD